MVSGALPPTSNNIPAAPPPYMNDFSMKARLLPYLEQNATFNALNSSFTYGTVQNSTARCMQINAFLCPSDGNVPCGTALVNTASVQIGYHSYPNNAGTYYMNNGGTFDGPAYMMGGNYGPTVTLASISDGTSNTAMFSEYIRGRNEKLSQGLHQVYRAADPDNVAVPLTKLQQDCQTGASGAVYTGTKGQDWLDQNCGKGGCYTHIMTPNMPGCVYSNVGVSRLTIIVGASSYHPGGVNVCFIDGSVHFIKNSINRVTWWALSTRAGGEVISADSL